MEQFIRAPPHLPPKTRISPPDATTVLNSTAAEVFSYKFQEVEESHSNISSSSVGNGNHVVKIHINPQENISLIREQPESVLCTLSPCVRISVNTDTDMIQSNSLPESFIKTPGDRNNPYFFCGSFMSSGQVSPSDTLDSGTCSDLDGTPPPLPKKKNSGVTVTVIGAQHKRPSSLTSSGADVDSDDNESNISCDSLNSGELPAEIVSSRPASLELESPTRVKKANAFLPQGLLQDIRDRSVKLSQIAVDDLDRQMTQTCLETCSVYETPASPKAIIDESTYEDRKQHEKEQKDNATLINSLTYDADRFYNFHLNEHVEEDKDIVPIRKVTEDESFAGYRDILGADGSSTIRSAKGTVRGVKNRVRAGIATFLHINSVTKCYKEKDAGKLVVYTTTMGIVRETYNNCMKVKQILRTLLLKYEERDVFMSNECRAEIRDRMSCEHVLVPQVFADGQHIGDVETIERLNETGELRRILKCYKSMDACTTCKVCGGYRLLPCPVCNGSKKSLHRNHFTTEFVALKCMNCDEVGLVRCTSCQ
uniref:Glutaredoxin domain-containing protein n=1 Tax=Photinus pyralis TaxID=7054 RepID=A0A1Y1LE31_PHOPY